MRKGHLKIFFGYAAGVGKTYSMLVAAREAKALGRDVVIGYVEPHDRAQTLALMEGLEALPKRQYQENGVAVEEFDLDGALARDPDLILVDEMAHTNASSSRHHKRYKDIEELLNAGIDVYTTVNVQHLESLNDTIAAITNVRVRERILDSSFDEADQVELVDIEPEELLERMKAGKIYAPAQAMQAMDNFFTLDHLRALREIALRRCAERVSRLQGASAPKGDEHILVCLSSSPSNERIIRTAARMAAAFKARFSAVYVQRDDEEWRGQENEKRLENHKRLAQQLGARIETLYGEDIAEQIATFSRLSHVTKIVLGRSAVSKPRFFPSPTLAERLIGQAPDLDVYIIPDKAGYKAQKKKLFRVMKPTRALLKSVLILAFVTIAGLALEMSGFPKTAILTTYVLGVLFASTLSASAFNGLVTSLVAVLLFNFAFTPPRYSFHALHAGDFLTLALMFAAALLTSRMAQKIRSSAESAARSAFKTKVLLETNQLLQSVEEEDVVFEIGAAQLRQLLDCPIVTYAYAKRRIGHGRVYGEGKELLLTPNERAVAYWCATNNKHAGASTDTLSSAKCLYLAVRLNEKVYGVVGIAMDEGARLDPLEQSIVLSVLGECALALEGIQSRAEKEQARMLAKNEQTRANLLRAISHDLRTPLTSISGNASNLLDNEAGMDEITRRQTIEDIYEESNWLIGLVENLLAITRIEEGKVALHPTLELFEELVEEALGHIRHNEDHEIATDGDPFLFVEADSRLVMQVLVNLVDNAIKYTPSGSRIEIAWRKEGERVRVEVKDEGEGIPDAVKARVFERFYCGDHEIVDSRRSLGLGLSLCESIVHAHGGSIEVKDNVPKGSVFTFTLPYRKVDLHE